MDDRREPKRARQACLNCRRKKARCSGEKPVCAFCARLNQVCTWNDNSSENHASAGPRGQSTAGMNTTDTSLAARVALLESKLYLLGNGAISNTFTSSFQEVHRNQNDSLDSSRSNQSINAQYPEPTRSISDAVADQGDFFSLPSQEILLALIDVYFTSCHNKPYAYFHESTFRRRFEDNNLPDYLLYAFVATACRFSEHEFYRDRQTEAIAAYSNASWMQISESSFSHSGGLELHMVQATNMLAVIDFTGGHPKLGWVKTALSIRFAQGLRLNEEPDDELTIVEREERRRTFWSVYLLDRLISLGPNRPPSFSDIDCLVHLPCSEQAFREGLMDNDAPTLDSFMENSTASNHQNIGHFAMTIIMASTLGGFIRSSLKWSPNNTRVLWDSRSEYARAHSILLHFESQSSCSFATLGDVLQHQFTTDGLIDHQRASHFVYSHGLFHLNHCLLNHPFILHHLFQRCPVPVPPSFIQEALQRCHLHATQLLDLLHDAQQFGPIVESSFYGYCAMTSGIINRLYESSQDPAMGKTASDRVQMALSFLERKPLRWPNHVHMARLLRSFQPDPATTVALIDPVAVSRKLPVKNGVILWQLLDYGWLPDVKMRQLVDQPDSAGARQKEQELTDASSQRATQQTTPLTPDALYFTERATPTNFLQNFFDVDVAGFWLQTPGWDSAI